MAINASVLLEEAKCFCGSGASTAQRLKLALLSRIVDVSGVVESFVDRSGITNQSQIDAISVLALSARAHGWWDKCDLIYPFVGGTATAHSQNLKSSNHAITWVGTVTHNANGITGDGLTGYGDSGYIPTTSGQVTQNSIHASIYRRTVGTTTLRYYVGTGTAFFLRLGTASDQFRSTLNDGASNSFSPVNLGFVMGSRIDSATKRTYYNTELTALRASNANTSTSFWILNTNAVGVIMTDANLASVTLGPGITFAEYQLMKSDWQTFQTALGRAV